MKNLVDILVEAQLVSVPLVLISLLCPQVILLVCQSLYIYIYIDAIFQNFSNLGNKLQSRKESSGVEDELPHPDEIQIDLGRVKEKDSASRNAVSTLLSSESGHSYSAGRIGKAATEHTTVKHDSERKSRHSKHNSNEKANTGSNIHHVATFMKDSILSKLHFIIC